MFDDKKYFHWSQIEYYALNLKFIKKRNSFLICIYNPNIFTYDDKFYEETKEKIWLSTDFKKLVSSTDLHALKFPINTSGDFFKVDGIRKRYGCWGRMDFVHTLEYKEKLDKCRDSSPFHENRLCQQKLNRNNCPEGSRDERLYLTIIPDDKIPKKRDFIENITKGSGISDYIIIFLFLFFIIYKLKKLNIFNVGTLFIMMILWMSY